MFTRREFIRDLSAGGALAWGGCASTGLLRYDDTLRDHCWMWGHDSGYYDGTGPGSVYNIPLSEPITMADACLRMGIPNVCAVTWDEPSDAYLRDFRKLKRVSWVTCGAIHGTHTIEERFYRLRDRAFRLLDRLPNLTGFDLDDYFSDDQPPEVYVEADGTRTQVCHAPSGHANLRDLRRRIDACGRPIDLRLVLYIDRVKDPALCAPALKLVDTVMAWTWTGSNIAKLRPNIERCRAVAPGKRLLMGIYMWDFGGKKPLAMDFMRAQLDVAHDLYHRHVVDGFIFHCTPLVNKKPAIEAVEYARAWLARHGEERRGGDRA